MDALKKLNDRLAEASIPVRVKQRGRNLALRAVLPCKPGDGLGRKRYEVTLRVPATTDGMRRAEREAHILAQRMADGSFDWKLYADPSKDASQLAIAPLICHLLGLELTEKMRSDLIVGVWDG